VIERAEDGSITRAMGVVQDIAERRANAAELERSRQLAQRASEAKGRFLANMSHEIRTPLTAVLGYAEFARDEIADPATMEFERLESHLDAVLRNGRHLSQLLDEVLDLSKVEAGQLRVEKAPADPREIVRDAVQMLEGSALERGLRIDLELAPSLPHTVRTDALRVRQILVNLIGNAVKLSDESDVRVAADTVERAEGVLDGTHAAELRVDVTDRAGGIDQSTLEDIFEPFVQAEVDAAAPRRAAGPAWDSRSRATSRICSAVASSPRAASARVRPSPCASRSTRRRWPRSGPRSTCRAPRFRHRGRVRRRPRARAATRPPADASSSRRTGPTTVA